jgi:hypothetical protein
VGTAISVAKPVSIKASLAALITKIGIANVQPSDQSNDGSHKEQSKGTLRGKKLSEQKSKEDNARKDTESIAPSLPGLWRGKTHDQNPTSQPESNPKHHEHGKGHERGHG